MSRIKYINNEIGNVKSDQYGVSIMATKYRLTLEESNRLIEAIRIRDDAIDSLRQRNEVLTEQLQMTQLREGMLMEEIVKRESLRTDVSVRVSPNKRIIQ